METQKQTKIVGAGGTPGGIGTFLLGFALACAGGWLLTIAGLVIILAGILMSLHIFFRPTSLFNTLVMLVLLFGGIGLIIRSLKPRPATQPDATKTE